MIALLGRGLRRAAVEWRLVLWLAFPALLGLLVPAAPVFAALAGGLPADDRLLDRLDGAAAVDLFNRTWPEAADALLVAGALAAAGSVFLGFLLHGAAARAVAAGPGPVRTDRLLAALGGGFFPLLRLFLLLAVLHAALLGAIHVGVDVAAALAATAVTDRAAYLLEATPWALGLAGVVLLRAGGRLALAEAALEPEGRSALSAFAYAVASFRCRPAALAVDLLCAAGGVAAFVLLAVPRLLLPQDGVLLVALGLALVQLPVLARSAARVAGLAAVLEALGGRPASRPESPDPAQEPPPPAGSW